MSERDTKPGAPAAEVVAEKAEHIEDVDSVVEKKLEAIEKKLEIPIKKAPSSVLKLLSDVDKTVLRINKLLAAPGGLASFLSTFNYTLYILAYAQTKSPSLTSLLQKFLSLIRTSSAVTKPSTATLVNAGAVPPIAALAVLISKARTTLRLFGTFPLYAWLRTLLTGPKPGADVVLHRIAILQASSYFTYQALENISLLADSGVVGPAFISAINRGDSKTARIYLWAYRAWLGGVSCDFLRLAREWQLESRRRTTRARMQSEGRAVAEYQDDEDAKFDQRWWTDAMIASAWFPMALHFSSSTGGLPGWNLGWMGLCGLVAGSTRASAASPKDGFNIVEADIPSHLAALASGLTTSTSLVTSYLNRIATYDIAGNLNAFTVFNDKVYEEAAASDARRAQGLPPRPLEGIPYTIKDSYKYLGLSITDGSPALKGVMSNEDSTLAKRLRDAGAVLLGKTNMPPMAAGGMQRGLYGRAESPYNPKYLTAAFSSGSSNGAATSLANSMAVFGLGSETVSSGRSPASNNALVCYTPSKGVLSCRGLVPLYITCDVPSPYARSVGDMLALLDVIAVPDEETKGDFYREQTFVPIPGPPKIGYSSLKNANALQGKRIGVPKMYVGQNDSDPHAKPTYVSLEVIAVWKQTAQDLEALGAEVVYTDFPLVTNYENDSASHEANNVVGAPSNWNHVERGVLIAKAWNTFLEQNNDPDIKSLRDIEDSAMLFPKPKPYVPDTFLEVRNWIDYAGLPSLLQQAEGESVFDVAGLEDAVKALEAQRKRDLEDWMTEHNLDVIAFPAQGDVGLADLEFNLESTKHSLQNGVKYSNGNRAIRHLGVPTVSVPMGVLEGKGMPVNITFAGRAYEDPKLLEYAYAFEQATKRRISPPLAPLETDIARKETQQEYGATSLNLSVGVRTTKLGEGKVGLDINGMISVDGTDREVQIFVDGQEAWKDKVATETWNVQLEHTPVRQEYLGWDLKPLPPKKAMVIVVARGDGLREEAKLLWAAVA
ncbi:amidase signature enzyme [Macroventuria anomochaeta]|uniref:Amidase signature enzyme n=1 Tax=Macroventuria anomochaeta TaxID=301207 RepID=A0ACB6S7S4_9PLEO|nr:amidase signature enzyme [Macroventuria anomochaeta]KAF2629408.1 amidase signature enzyme [Macroventuria anomochaeta]